MDQQQSTIQDDFLAEVRGAALDFPGSAGQPIVRPKTHLVKPYHWKAAEIERLTELASNMALGERRMLRLANPGTPGKVRPADDRSDGCERLRCRQQ